MSYTYTIFILKIINLKGNKQLFSRLDIRQKVDIHSSWRLSQY